MGTTIVQLSIGRCSWLQNLIPIWFLANNCYCGKYRRQQIYVCGTFRISKYLIFVVSLAVNAIFGKSRFAFPHTSLPPYQGHLSWSVNFKTDRKTWYFTCAPADIKGGQRNMLGGRIKSICRRCREGLRGKILHSQYTVKNVTDFPGPSRDVTYQTLPGRE